MRVLIFGTTLLLGLLILAACGEGEGPESQQPPTPTLSPEQEAALAPCLALDGLKTYRFQSHLKLESPQPPPDATPPPLPEPTPPRASAFVGDFLFEYGVEEGEFQAPDRVSVVITGGSTPLPIILVGDMGWVQLTGRWRERPDEVVPYQPRDVCWAVFPQLDLSTVQPQTETINDIQTLHYQLPEVAPGQALAQIFGPNSDVTVLTQKMSVDVWLVEEENWPARMEIRSRSLYADGRELLMELLADVWDANDKTIKIEAPT